MVPYVLIHKVTSWEYKKKVLGFQLLSNRISTWIRFSVWGFKRPCQACKKVDRLQSGRAQLMHTLFTHLFLGHWLAITLQFTRGISLKSFFFLLVADFEENRSLWTELTYIWRIQFMPLTVVFSFMLALLMRIGNVLFSSFSVLQMLMIHLHISVRFWDQTTNSIGR
jgi:hypothetical protein